VWDPRVERVRAEMAKDRKVREADKNFDAFLRILGADNTGLSRKL
jgi:hypothetical protein